MSPQRKMLLGEFERAVLLVVARLGDGAYGVPIRQELEARLNRPVSVGAVYATLDRLAEKGFVSSSVGEPTATRGGRAKKYFRVEASGIEALNDVQMLYSLLSALPVSR